MFFKKFIDFEKLLSAELCSIVNETNTNETPFIKQNANSELYVDVEINQVSLELKDSYAKMLLDASNNKYNRLKDVYIKPLIDKLENGISIKTAKFYRSVHFYITYFVVSNDDDELIFMGIINKTTKKYLFLGNAGEHPWMATKDFIYGNSDGSGPNISEMMGTSPIASKILIGMMKYYTEFSNDMHH